MERLPFDLAPFTKRSTPNDSAVHTEFTDECRIRLFKFFTNIASQEEIRAAHTELSQEYIREMEGFKDNSGSIEGRFNQFIAHEDHEFVLEYVEYLYNIIWSSGRDRDTLLKHDSRFRRIFRDTRILVEIKPDHGDLGQKFRTKHSTRRYYPAKDGAITFHIIGSEALLSADSDVQKLAQNTEWADAVEPYNEAWERYQDGDLDLVLFQRLNHALENVVYRICKEKLDIADEGDGLGPCLNELQELDFFEPNNEVYGEWSQIAKGLQIALRKPSSDKKRHGDFPEDYTILVLHQTAAFLTFLIQRFENEYN